MSTTVHPSRISQIPTTNTQTFKRKKKKPPKPQPASTSLSRSQLRKKIRDLSRLLTSATTTTGTSSKPSKLPATARSETERALEAYKHELYLQQSSTKRLALQKRYHKVRFFESRKATRALARLNRQLAGIDDESEKKELEAKVHDAEVDLNYITHYPPLEKYISLYKTGDDKATNDKRESIRRDIEKRMEDGTLDNVNNLASGESFDSKKQHKDDKKKKKRSKQNGIPEEKVGDGEDEGSDGGFFEL